MNQLGDAPSFLEKIFGELEGLQFAPPAKIDHICWRTSSHENYVKACDVARQFSDIIAEAPVRGRPISTFRLREPLRFKNYSIALLEIPAPKPGVPTPDGFDHIEFTTLEDLRDFAARFPRLSFETKGLSNPLNADIELKLKDGLGVKIHNMGLQETIAIEQLDKPGAGAGEIQSAIGRWITFPLFCLKTSDADAHHVIQSSGRKILEEARALDPKLLHRRKLVPPQQFLEDSSRAWSVAMTLEHVVIVGSQISQALPALLAGKAPSGSARTAAVKPKPGAGSAEAFEDFLKNYSSVVPEDLPKTTVTFDHPWFGPLNAHKWHCLVGLHQLIHLKQIRAIKKELLS